MKLLLHIPEIHQLIEETPCYMDAHAVESSDSRFYVRGAEDLFWLTEANQILCEYLSSQCVMDTASDFTYYEFAIEALKLPLEAIASHIKETLARAFHQHSPPCIQEVTIVCGSGKLMLGIVSKEIVPHGRSHRLKLQRKSRQL